MKTILTALALILTTSAAMAFGLPPHQQNGWRDTGCDQAANVEIKNDAGKVLYLNNPTCPGGGGSGTGTAGTLAALVDLLNPPAESPAESPSGDDTAAK